MGAKFDKVKCASQLRQAQARMNIHRSKKLTGIAKKKDDICKHLEAGNEVNAKIWAETLINEENQVPVYDVVSTMCDQINGRLTQIAKFGPPKDMNATFATVIHAAPKLDIDELLKVRTQLGSLLEPEFVKECDTNYDLLNPVVAKNIDFKTPEEGEVIMRLCQLAKERNIEYQPTHESSQALHAYCLRKGIPAPDGVGGPDGPVPTYAPQPMMQDFNALDQAPSNQPPGGGGGHISGDYGMPPQQPPAYMPPVQPAYMPPVQPMMPPQDPMMPPVGGAYPVMQPPANPGYDAAVTGMPVQPQPPADMQAPQDKQNNADPVDDFQARIDALKNM